MNAMEPTLAPVMEVVSVPGTISGSAIIDDLLNRIVDKLSRDCSLRPIDVYSGYAAKVQITLQLTDVYPVEVAAEIHVGAINAQLPAAHIDLGGEVEATAAESGSLERPVDPAGAVPEAPPRSKRFYTPKGTQPLSLRGHK